MGEVYDRIIFGEESYDFVAGPPAFRRRMEEYFPAEVRAIDRYVELLSSVGRWGGLYFSERALDGVSAPSPARRCAPPSCAGRVGPPSRCSKN